MRSDDGEADTSRGGGGGGGGAGPVLQVMGRPGAPQPAELRATSLNRYSLSGSRPVT